ncbi:MAG TPA: GAF domain-containing protein [Vicinamibacterales bacterium]|nr:GAF domain-containing protein [Vicinamibacterales bacterium]
MALEDRIRSSVDTALGELTVRLDQDVRAIIQQLVTAALEERDEALAVARRATLEEANAKAEQRLEERVTDAQVKEREAELAALTRLLESIRGLDGATSLGEVLDALGQAAGREASRAAVLVVRNERLLGWKLCGFGPRDNQPKGIDLGLHDSGVVGVAVGTARPVTTRDSQPAADGPGFAHLPSDRMGFAVPVIVGGRVVAVVYADTVTSDGREHVVPSGWPEVIEILSRHAARCLESLTVQKAASAPSPRFWVPGAARGTAPAAGPESKPASATAAPRGSDAPPGVTV